MSYYERTSTEHVDGTPLFATRSDQTHERRVAHAIERAWKCVLHDFGALCPLDWYATRAERLVGVLELKSRTHATDRYPTVFLNVRKWLALLLANTGLGVPAIFVVRFTDEIRWVNVSLTMGVTDIAGCRTVVKSHTDIEPVIGVPVAAMRALERRALPARDLFE
jgi:hypothetical protein